jgi:hypothetical protein
MAKYQRKPEIREFILDKSGNAHEIVGGLLSGEEIGALTFEKEWEPVPLPPQG